MGGLRPPGNVVGYVQFLSSEGVKGPSHRGQPANLGFPAGGFVGLGHKTTMGVALQNLPGICNSVVGLGWLTPSSISLRPAPPP